MGSFFYSTPLSRRFRRQYATIFPVLGSDIARMPPPTGRTARAIRAFAAPFK